MTNEIDKLFRDEVAEKKRAGRGIFSRVSTRKGGTNQALRTPYLYMSNREKRNLNGEVEVFNMNEILKWNEFNALKEDRQLELMKHWRVKYLTKEIKEGLGVSNYVFYKTLKRLGLELDESKSPMKSQLRIKLSEHELEDVLKSQEFIAFSKFKTLNYAQQMVIFENYLERSGGQVSKLLRAWKGSEDGYLYYVSGKVKKKKAKESQEVPVEDGMDESEELKADEPVEALVEDYVDSPVIESPQEDSITAKIQASSNTFSFNLQGEFKPESIIRRLQLLQEELKETEESLIVELNITTRG